MVDAMKPMLKGCGFDVGGEDLASLGDDDDRDVADGESVSGVRGGENSSSRLFRFDFIPPTNFSTTKSLWPINSCSLSCTSPLNFFTAAEALPSFTESGSQNMASFNRATLALTIFI